MLRGGMQSPPVPDSNLAEDSNRGRPPMADTHTPRVLVSWLYPFTVLPVKARSVP